jgi:hypothetical protein
MKTYILTFQCGTFYSTANNEKEAVVKLGRGEPACISILEEREKIIKDKLNKISKLFKELDDLIN